MGKYYYAILWLAIGIISAIDVYWAVANQNVLMQSEENPIGRYLIEKDNGSIALFMCMKVIGTVLVLGTLISLYHWKKTYAWPTIITLTIAQFCLLSYLGRGCLVSTQKTNENFKWQHTSTNAKPVNIFSQKNYR